jgi:hypothetical protein
VDITLGKPPLKIQGDQEKQEKALRIRAFQLDDKQLDELEGRLKQWVESWERNTNTLRRRLVEANDHLEGVSEDVEFPWPGASKVTMGFAAGMARTLRAVFDRAVFPDNRPFAAEQMGDQKTEERNQQENAVNWLSRKHNNLVEALRNTPIPAFRDGTVPIMGEWERRIEKVCETRVYNDAESFQEDYPTPEDAGVDEKKYTKIVRHLRKMDNFVSVEWLRDQVLKDAPKFTAFPLARLIWYPVFNVEHLNECRIYGRLYYESEQDVLQKIKRNVYMEKRARESLAAAHGVRMGADAWGSSRDSIEGLVGDDDATKFLRVAKLVLCDDLDGDDIPERYLISLDIDNFKILRIERYKLRKNVPNIILFGFMRRDQRLLRTSLLLDGIDQFRMIDNIHRHRNNVRAITDCPAFLVPDSIKDQVDFGAGSSVFKPGVTWYLQDRYMKEDMAPRQLLIQSLSKTGESLDEEKGVVRYLEFRLGPSQGLSGQESMIDPNAPATKTVAQLKQATLRIDDLIREWKTSVPEVIELMLALYHCYGQDKYKVGVVDEQSGDIGKFEDITRQLFMQDDSRFMLRHNELSLSPEFEMEKTMGIAAIAAQNPLVLQAKPEVVLHTWNDLVLSSRVSDPKRYLIPVPTAQAPEPGGQPGGLFATLRGNNNNALNGRAPGDATINQESAAAIANFLPTRGGKGGSATSR